MQEHEQRVVVEKEELDGKLAKLIEFMHTSTYGSMPDIEQGLLMVQQVAMENYSSVLGRRIELFS